MHEYGLAEGVLATVRQRAAGRKVAGRPGRGAWILVHMGFALNVMSPEEAADALAALGAEREAGRDEAGQDEAGQDEAAALHAAMNAGPPQDVIARWMS